MTNNVGGVEVSVKGSYRRNGIADTTISAVVMAVFELDDDGRIKQWREAYDLNSLTRQIESALHRP